MLLGRTLRLVDLQTREYQASVPAHLGFWAFTERRKARHRFRRSDSGVRAATGDASSGAAAVLVRASMIRAAVSRTRWRVLGQLLAYRFSAFVPVFAIAPDVRNAALLAVNNQRRNAAVCFASVVSTGNRRENRND